jgi:crotonobetainyl-CoA:carnitine CoA-transferase CaiB-like acyl-CoA transferase
MLPLEGVKVVDFSTWAFAPVCAAALADWGADVVKIEHPRTGDVFRWFLTLGGFDDSQMPVSLFGLDNRNKKGMAIDLKQAEGRKIVHQLIEGADIFISNLPRDALEKLDMDYPRLSSINPKIIYAHASGFGDEGPDAKKPGFDSTAYWARSGLMAGLAVNEQPPVFQQYPGIGDQISGLVFFGGVLLALLNRQKTGLGQQVDLSLLGVGTWVTSCALQFVLSTGEEPPRFPRERIVNPLANCYKGKDDEWLMIMCLPDQPYWSPLCNALGRGDLENDPKFSTREKRLENNVELISIIDNVIATKTRDEWGIIFDRRRIVWTKIPSTFEEVTKDPQVLANDHIVVVEHPSKGPSKIITTPIRLNKKAPEIRNLAPEIGEHNEEILLKLGYTWEQIATLKDKGIIP